MFVCMYVYDFLVLCSLISFLEKKKDIRRWFALSSNEKHLLEPSASLELCSRCLVVKRHLSSAQQTLRGRTARTFSLLQLAS